MIRILLLVIFAIIISSCTFNENSDWAIKSEKILTKWADDVNPENALPEYPRPQMVRDEWMNLNGLWDYAIVPKKQLKVKNYDGKILVPFPVESALSGIQKVVSPEQRVWYYTTFTLPKNWNDNKILLHFEAVDWETIVWVNGKELGSHRGGYDEFYFDITEVINPGETQTLTLAVWDPTDQGQQPRGKQVLKPGGIMYTAVTGIWQTVWLEPVEKNKGYIESIKLTPDIDENTLTVLTNVVGGNQNDIISIIAKVGEDVIAEYSGNAKDQALLSIDKPHLWTPENPYLYDLEIQLLSNGEVVDKITSYFGMRKTSIAKDEDGIVRIMLNNKFVFQYGPLDQGWWPDGLYTAPTDEALKYDIQLTKQLGFNMARKHVKVEPERWYYWCDKLGLLVWQDMPSGWSDIYLGEEGPASDEHFPKHTEQSAAQFELELDEMLREFGNHPSIIVWVSFNEGWGQYETERITKLVEELDPNRLVNSASGWVDMNVGHIKDIHAYPGPDIPAPEVNRAIVLGEFGGLGLPLEGHTWQSSDNWGYRSYENVTELTEAYINLNRELQGFIKKGLSAAVYTQTTDVEVEVNGLMTYDRALIKINPDDLMKINKGFLPPTFSSESNIFLESMTVELSNAIQKGNIYYTLDGSEPDTNKTLYDKPIDIGETTTLKTRTYWNDGTSSSINQKTFTKVVPLTSIQKEFSAGLNYSYYEDGIVEFEKLPEFENLKAKTEGITDQFNLNKAERDEYYAIRFEGFIDVPSAGIYRFYSESDDGSKLYIHNELIVENDYTHGMREKFGDIALAKAKHPIILTFFQGEEEKGLRVSYSGPGIEKTEIPAKALYRVKN
jgi:hypothetical protein